MVGGGPAGATASLLMARKGVDVTLFDKANFPRDKACGDVVGPRAVRILSEIGIGLPEERWPVGEMFALRMWLATFSKCGCSAGKSPVIVT